MSQELFNYMTSTLSRDFMRERSSFWNSSYPDTKVEYAKLNNISNINDQMIHNIQLRSLASIARTVFNDQNIKNLGEQILNIGNAQIDNNILEQTVINRTLEATSKLFSVNVTRENKEITSINKSWQAYSKTYEAIKALNELTQNTTGAYSREVLEKTSNLLSKYKIANDITSTQYYQALKGTGFGSDNDLIWFFKNLKAIQGSLLEERATEWLQEKIPLVTTIDENGNPEKLGVINIGLLNFGGKQPGVDISLIQIKNKVKLRYKQGKQKNWSNITLKQLLDLLDKADNASERISLDDQSIDTLANLMKLNIQAKSGKGQKPFNKVTVTLGNLTIPQTALGKMSAYSIFYSLQQLEKETWNKNKQRIETQDNGIYSAIANYALSTYMGNIMNYGLNISREEMNNQYLLTPNGFMNYGDRMKELLGTAEYIQLKGAVNISGTMLMQPHEVVMPHAWWYYR